MSECCEKCGRPLDLIRTCPSCGMRWTLSLEHSKWFYVRGMVPPAKCADCRRKTKNVSTGAGAPRTESKS